MSRKDKLVNKARENPGSLAFSELERLVRYFGYTQVRQSGSHRIFRRAGEGYRRFNFQEHNGEAKIAQVREFVDYAEEMGWI